MNSILLEYSRSAESQADIMGTQVLFDTAYDPRGMGEFFEKLEAQQSGRGPAEFFSNHPSPENRIERVAQEVAALGGAGRDDRSNSREFDDIKRYLQSMPGPTSQGYDRPRAATGNGTTPDRPSGRYVSAENSYLRINHPDNALSTYLSNDSPVGGRETDWLVTLESPDGLVFIVLAAPEPEFQRYEGAFHEMVRSVRIRRQAASHEPKTEVRIPE